jgi:hypothetical protein
MEVVYIIPCNVKSLLDEVAKESMHFQVHRGAYDIVVEK